MFQSVICFQPVFLQIHSDGEGGWEKSESDSDTDSSGTEYEPVEHDRDLNEVSRTTFNFSEVDIYVIIFRFDAHCYIES